MDPAKAYAPGVERAGQSYCLGERQHGGRALSMHWLPYGERAIGSLSFTVPGGLAWIAVADVDTVPIALLAQQANSHWHNGGKELAEWSLDLPLWEAMTRLTRGDTSDWTAQRLRQREVKVAGVELGSSVDAKAGHSYVVRGRLASIDLEFSVALQVFSTPDSGKILVAWSFLQLLGSPSVPPEVLPWWNWRSWAEYVRGFQTKAS